MYAYCCENNLSIKREKSRGEKLLKVARLPDDTRGVSAKRLPGALEMRVFNTGIRREVKPILRAMP